MGIEEESRGGLGRGWSICSERPGDVQAMRGTADAGERVGGGAEVGRELFVARCSTVPPADYKLIDIIARASCKKSSLYSKSISFDSSKVLNVLLNMEKGKPDDKVLSYNDVVLRRSDLDILSGPYFLNDRIIEFYFSYLTSCYPSEDILLVPPSIAFWIKECPDSASLKDFVEPLHLSTRKLIIFPINDNEDVTMAEGGSHWSLLAFERNANAFAHHDSSSSSFNAANAKRVYRAVTSYTAPGATFVDWPNTPKQVNGYDCGVYVTAITRSICEWYFSEAPKDMEGLWFPTVKEQVTPSAVSIMRREILDLVRSLMTKQ
ncbi:Cysteine proteinases superfamily protein [Perilla frutescens var. hirtella]|nr:Cysteine proteinases superfamily protein [Perilla frutescens var. hirtella]